VQAPRRVTLWSADGLTVQARRDPDHDGLVIEGQDLRSEAFFGTGVTEYEYALTVAEADLPAVLTALRAEPDADVLDVLAATGSEVVAAGEAAWLTRLGIEFEFWSRLE
jgi:hypothetical protein